LTEIIIVDSRFKGFMIKTRQEGIKGQGRIFFKTMFIAEIVLERNNMLPPVDGRVVSVEPIDTEDDGMGLELGDVKGERFTMMLGDGDLEIGLLGDRARGAGVAISHVETDGVRE
jgi:hypothetical protein